MWTQPWIAVVLLPPLGFAVAALASRRRSGARPAGLLRWMRAVAGAGAAAAVASAVITARHGILETGTLGWAGVGLSLRLDPLSAVMLVMISLLAWVIVRFSCNYLDGDARQGQFLGRLAATIASVQMLVLAGNLGLLLAAWVGTSVCLHTLLTFYPERPRARIAARKKFLVARLGDACLLSACGLLYAACGSGNLEFIFRRATEVGGDSMFLEVATALIALAAILKSAQFPAHGWLVEVMETPTPVSALLHAGILNAGPFLVIRMAMVMQESTSAPVLLVAFGGFTALFASVVLLTQPSIKVVLGYSSAAHMGFMLMVCGLGVYPAVVLHLVAHSFYKAHAFLSSGSVIDAVRARVNVPARLGDPLRIVCSVLLAAACYGMFAWLWGVHPLEEPALLAVGAILVMGLAQLIAPALDSDGPWLGVVLACLLAVLTAAAFFGLESGTHLLLRDVLPDPERPTWPTLLLAGLVLFAFGSGVLLQIIGLSRWDGAWSRHLAVHLRNGLYANALLDRWVGGLRMSCGADDGSTQGTFATSAGRSWRTARSGAAASQAWVGARRRKPGIQGDRHVASGA